MCLQQTDLCKLIEVMEKRETVASRLSPPDYICEFIFFFF